MSVRLSLRLACLGFSLGVAAIGLADVAAAKGFGGGVRGGGFVAVPGRGHVGQGRWGGGYGGGHWSRGPRGPNHWAGGPWGHGRWGNGRWGHGHWGHGRFGYHHRFGHRGRFDREYGFGGLPYYGGYGFPGYNPGGSPPIANALSVGQPTVGIPPSPVLPPAIYVVGSKPGRVGIGRGVARKRHGRGSVLEAGPGGEGGSDAVVVRGGR